MQDHFSLISTQIDQILNARKQRLPEFEQQMAKLDKLHTQVAAIATLLAQASELSQTDEKRTGPLRAEAAKLLNELNEASAALDVVRRRYARKTINIGVGGAARQGKSTLLQNISGLSENEIPTAAFYFTTAVRSRIYHTDDAPYAIIHLRDFAAFRKDQLEHYHKALELGPAPLTPDAFQAVVYPETVDNVDDSSKNKEFLVRLKKMQKAFPRYRQYLTGGTLELKQKDFENLKQWVTYPKEDETDPARLDLAVKDVEIYSRFPAAQVKSVGIVDIPGLGEIIPDAKEMVVEGLRDDVDLVLFVKKPEPSKVEWDKSDTEAFDLIDLVRHPNIRRQDFMNFVLNEDREREDSAQINDAAKRKVHEKFNDGSTESPYAIYSCSALDKEDVAENLLLPALRVLSRSLAEMDSNVAQTAIGHVAELERELSGFLKDVENLVNGLRGSTDNRTKIAELLNGKTGVKTGMKVRLSSRLKASQTRLREAMIANRGKDEDFEAQLKTIVADIIHWAENGYEAENAEEWMRTYALQAEGDPHGLQGVSNIMIAQIRTHISNRFTGLDAYYTDRIRKEQEQIVDDLRAELGEQLLAGDDVVTALSTLTDYARKITPSGGANLCRSVERFQELRFEYKSHVHPYIRKNLDILDPNAKRTELKEFHHKQFPSRIDGHSAFLEIAKAHLNAYQDLTRRATTELRQVLRDEWAQSLLRVLFAAVEQLEDDIIRSSESDAEWDDLAHMYYAEIWPDEFPDMSVTIELVGQMEHHISAVYGLI